MRTSKLTAGVLALVALAGCSDTTGISPQDLQGSWSATVFEYTDNASPLVKEDIILSDGASFDMTVDDAGSVSTQFDDGMGSTSSDSGTFDGTSTTLTLGGMVFDAVRNGDVLTLTDADQSFDFGSGSTSATLRVVLNRT